MDELIWTESALLNLDEVAEYITLDDPLAAANYVQKVFDRVERLTIYPNSGKRPEELPRTPIDKLSFLHVAYSIVSKMILYTFCMSCVRKDYFNDFC